ncbi:MAG: hypothetical protein JNK05_01555 [Myxococcales bacterium]|nr:hypothetical protein [Myxococcales bacterium]
MAPKITRPTEPSWMLLAATACGLSATVLGYVLAQGAFSRILHRAPDPAHTSQEPDTDDGGARESSADASATATADPRREPLVPVRITRVELVSCGDGDELDTEGSRCDASPEIERVLRESLSKLGDCPAALVAGANPAQVLSIGLRVDFARRIVVPVQGRASSVRDPLTFVACARQRGGMGPIDALWEQRHAKARYQYVVMMRFGPLGAAAQRALDAGADEPTQSSTPAVPTASAARDAGESRRVLRPGEPCPVTPGTADNPCPGYIVTPPRLDAGSDDPTLSQPVTVFMGTPLARTEPATVTWTRALIRAEPRTGVVITRIPINTAVTIEARSGSWYRVRWATGMGWVFGEAIGRGGDAGVTTGSGGT